MAARTPQPEATHGPNWVTNMVRAEPRVPLAGPYMFYLLLMILTGLLPASLQHVAIVAHIAGAAWAIWLVRRHWPSLGRPHLPVAVAVGGLAAWLWISGQHWLSGIEVAGSSLGGMLSLTTHLPFLELTDLKIEDVPQQFATATDFRVHVVLKISRAVTVVPIVEELFWRGFILRALVHWDRFDEVPLGKFTWFAFLGSSLLSVLQHPGNWGMSIACWMLYNAVFYWKRSLSCLMIAHGITNLALYVYVVQSGDWQLW